MEMLTLSHVAKNFGEKQVLRDVSFSVPEHTVFGFVGQNGAGKTTAMKMILGPLTISSGDYAEWNAGLLRKYPHKPACGLSAGRS